MPIRWTNSDSYTSEMIRPRTVPLFDPDAQPASWNERMSHGEYAVHYSSFDQVAREIGPSCTVLGSLEGAEEYAKAQVMLNPELRCRIYDDRGFVERPSSKSADSDTKERVKSHHASADGSDRCYFSVGSHWSSWTGARTSSSHGPQRSAHACLFRALSCS
jgi:hypothetical protein